MKILSIEDSKEIQILIGLALNNQFEVEFADDYNTGLSKLTQKHYDCILIDINLPDKSGFSIFEHIAKMDKTSETAVIFLTSETSEVTIADALNQGADDYIVKPIKPIEFAARINNRISKITKSQSSEFIAGPFKFNIYSSKVFINSHQGPSEVSLTPIEYKILLKISKSPGKIFTREMLINDLWGNEYFLESRSIDKHISSLRNKIKPFGKHIKTKSGQGYFFDSEEVHETL